MDMIQSIREGILRELPKWDQPSIAVGIVKDGQVVLNEGFGWANEEKGLKADAETLYEIGSCSKAFTAAACALLVDQGRLQWDAPARDYLPWLEFKDPYVTAHVTVRDLLCHRTGLPRHDAYWIDGPCTRREMVENLRTMQPCWSFRTKWCYQNTCYVAAGMLIEAISYISLHKDFMRKADAFGNVEGEGASCLAGLQTEERLHPLLIEEHGAVADAFSCFGHGL